MPIKSRTVYIPPFSATRLHYNGRQSAMFAPGGGTWDILTNGRTMWLRAHRSGEKWMVAKGYEAATEAFKAPTIKTLSVVWEQESETKWSAPHPLYDNRRMRLERFDHHSADNARKWQWWRGEAQGVQPLDGGETASAVAWSVTGDVLKLAFQIIYWNREATPFVSERAYDFLRLSSGEPV